MGSDVADTATNRAPPLQVPAKRVAIQRPWERSKTMCGLAISALLLQLETPKNVQLDTCLALAPLRDVMRVASLTTCTTWVSLTAIDGLAGSTQGRDVPHEIAWSVRPVQAGPITPGPPPAAGSSASDTAAVDEAARSGAGAAPVTAAGSALGRTAAVAPAALAPAPPAGRSPRSQLTRPGTGRAASCGPGPVAASVRNDARPTGTRCVVRVARESWPGFAARAAGAGPPGTTASRPASSATAIARERRGRRIGDECGIVSPGRAGLDERYHRPGPFRHGPIGTGRRPDRPRATGSNGRGRA